MIRLSFGVVWIGCSAVLGCGGGSDNLDSTGGTSGGAGGSVSAGGSSAGNATGGVGVGGAATGGTATGGTGTGGSGGGVTPGSSWTNVTNTLAGMASGCGNLARINAQPGTNRVIAGVATVGFFASDDAGATWTQLPAAGGPKNSATSMVFDPEDATIFYLSVIYNDGGVYKTSDNGDTFQKLGDIVHIDLVSVDFTDPDRKTLLAGGHEAPQTLHRSSDSGQTWTNVGANLPDGSHFSSYPVVVDATHHLLGACGAGDGDCGVFRSTDSGDSWSKVSNLGVMAPALWASDGTMYFPQVWDRGMIVSKDDGATWQGTVGYGVVHAFTPIELPDGRLLSVGDDHVKVSADGSKTWTNVGDATPYKPSGVAYSPAAKTMFIWHNDCGSNVLADAIMSAGWDYATQ